MSDEKGCGCGSESVEKPPVELNVLHSGDDGGESCCGTVTLPPSGAAAMERPGIFVWPFVAEWVETEAGLLPRVSHEITAGDKRGAAAMRMGLGRDSYRIAPGIYIFGTPTAESPVLVTCNYKLTFDYLRKVWEGESYWVLVLETYGVNVWCAAGKGTFGTAEVINRVKASGIEKLVNHKELILPQLGAPGVKAHEVKKGCGFKVVYGPVRAEDLVEYIAAGKIATAEMRQVNFTLMDRVVLIPVELSLLIGPLKWLLPTLFILSGISPDIWSLGDGFFRGLALFGALLGGALGGAVITPILLPWLPGRYFSLRGLIPGAAVLLALLILFGGPLNWLESLGFLSIGLGVASYAAMNFTGTTTFTAPTGVEKEMRRFVPVQAALGGVGILAWIIGAFI